MMRVENKDFAAHPMTRKLLTEHWRYPAPQEPIWKKDFREHEFPFLLAVFAAAGLLYIAVYFPTR